MNYFNLKYYLTFALVMVGTVIISAQNTTDTVKTGSGLKYVISQHGTGVVPKAGDNVSVHYTLKLTDGKVIESSRTQGTPISFTLGKGQVIRGWDEGISLLHVGDKATFIVPPSIGYGSRANGQIPPNSTLVFDLELMDVKEPVKPKPFDVGKKDTMTTASGLKYIIIQQGSGVSPEQGKNVSVHYTGYFTDGKIFDSSVERGAPYQFPIGKGQVIKGWDEGIALLKVGGKARLIIPYQLAYGEAGRPPQIPAKSTLIFDVELMGADVGNK